MKRHPKPIETQIVKFYRSLNGRDRRRYAAVEANRLGHGGLEYISQLLSCDPKTIRQGLKEIEVEGAPPTERVRKKGVDEKP